MFLTPEELAQLTGRKIKSRQIAWLRGEAIAYRVSATGHPVVARAAIDGRGAPAPVARTWQPRVVGAC
jgi:hypothetical protein